MRQLSGLIVLAFIAGLLYLILTSESLQRKPEATGSQPEPEAAAAITPVRRVEPSPQPAAEPQPDDQQQTSQTESRRRSDPASTVKGVVRSGKNLGQNTSRAFGGVSFGGK